MRDRPLALDPASPMPQAARHRWRARSAAGLLIALVLPALATFRLGFTDTAAAVALAMTPWLTLMWVLVVERRPLSSIGLGGRRWNFIAFALTGAAINVAITAGVTLLCARLGLRETQSALMGRLLQGPGLLLVFLVANGALLTELSFRAYSIERLGEWIGGRYRLAALAQIAVTTTIFVVGRGWAHGAVWLVDDVVFTAYYLRTRNTPVCIAAHAIPNLLASSLVALGLDP